LLPVFWLFAGAGKIRKWESGKVGKWAALVLLTFSLSHLLTCPLLAAPPAITTQPQKRTVVEGSSYTFSVTATGTAPLAYQWRRNNSELSGQTSSSLALTSIQTNDAGGYSVVVTNAEGAVTSLVAQLTVRLASDPAYPTPQGGWTYLFHGGDVANSLTAALDGSWNHENNSDAWSGDGRGVGNELAGGVSTTNGILTIEDVVASGSGFNNRRYYFTRDLAQEPGVTNASTLLNDGVTLTFRARLTPPTDPLLELTNAPNGLVNISDGKGMFGIRQAGSSGLLISFSLSQATEDTSTSTSFNFAQAGLHMNNLNGDARSAAVDPGEGGSTNLLALDPTAFHEFWITIQDNGADPGTHRVSIYLDGGKTATTFNVTAGSGSDGPAANYLALGLGSSVQRGAVDVDFFGYQAGVVLPSAFNEPVGIVLQPAAQYVVAGQMASYTVGVTGTPPYRFQWYRDGAAIDGATNATYSTAPVTAGDAGALFHVVVANDCNSVTSSPPASLQLLGAPIITSQPSSLTVTNGDAATFTVAVTSPVTPTYQWRLNSGNLAGQTNATLTIANTTPASAGGYDVVIANASGSVTSTVAVLTVVRFDFGDAADPAFPTLKASDGARHRILPGIYLGNVIDTEADGQPSANATGDDASGSDDEDGVTFLTPLLVGQTTTVQVVASTNGFLNAWLDCDHNGSWIGAGEQILTNTPLVTGTNTLLLAVPAHTAPGAAPARFRFDTAGGLSFTGPAADGEVEDYAPTILPVADLSVAQTATPDPVAVNATLTCAITVSNAGPSTAASVVTTNKLPAGATFMSVVSSQGSCLYLAGELTCDLGAFSSGASATITLMFKPTAAGTLTNTVRVSSAATDPETANNSATVILSALAPPAITTPPQNRTVTNGSAATFTVIATGASPLTYQWYFTPSGPPTSRPAGLQTGETNATITIANAQPADDGAYTVRLTNPVGALDSPAATLTVLVPPSITAQPQSQTNLAGGTASFAVTGAGSAPLNYQWTFNGTNLAGQTGPTLALANLQLTNAGSYRAVLSNAAGAITSAVATLAVIAMDFGDAPDTYRTALATNGARHRVVPAIRLGAAVDFEPDGQPDATATGDDTAGANDEDGIVFTTPIRAGQTVSLTAVASSNGVLNAWLDYNRNGTWADAGEQIFINRNLPTGTNNLVFTVPGGVSAGPSYARFRFSTASGLSFDGEAPSGEVEDYAVTIENVSDLAITRMTQISPIATGSNQIYSLTVSNAGPSAATGVSLTDTLPAGVSFVSAVSSQGGCTHSAGLVTCALGDVSVGANVAIQIDTIPTTAGSLTNSVSVGGNQLDLNPANNTLLAVATVQDLPMIQLDPQSQIVTNGGTANFSVTASGTALRYQWLLNGTAVSGGTNATLAVVNAQPANAGAYTVRVTNLVGALLSAPATLTVLGPVSINTQPQSQTVLAGSTVTFTVAASGSPPITYQWELDGSDLPGQTGSSLLLPSVQTNQAGAYRVRVTNPIGSVNSAPATLTVLEMPLFLLQPQSQTNAAGTTATLTALVAGTAPLRYQWHYSSSPLPPFSFSPVAGQTNTSVIFTNAQTTRSGAYTLTASNIAGVRTSAVAMLTIYELDFGDAPEASGYPTTLAFNGARHRLLPGVRLGPLADFETNGAPNTTANGDDLAGVDDEDGVIFPASLLVGQTALVPVIASTNGFLDAWIDFNGNGSWGDPGEQVLASRLLTPGTNSVPFAISPGALPGLRYARCRFSTTGGLAYDGFAPDGEVEDHRLTLAAAVDLAVGLTIATNPVQVLDEVTYLMTVTNRGPSTATSVNLTNILPPSMTYVAGTPSQGYCTDIGSDAFCPIDNIAPGAVVTITLRVRATLPGSFTSTAVVHANETEVNPADNTATQNTAVILPPTSYTNAAALPVADATAAGPGLGNPYPSTIFVTGLTSAVYKVTARLNNLSHPFSKDFDVLLVGPQGQSALLMSDTGAGALNNVTLHFDDAADVALPSTGVIGTGSYRPSNYGAGADVFPGSAPAGPYANALSAFNGTDPNGLWSLYVVDGTIGGNGAIAGGWQLTLHTTDPIADLALLGSVNGIVTNVALPVTDPLLKVAVNSNLLYTLTVTNRGPAVADNVVLTNTLPSGVTFISATTTLGACTPQANLLTCALGNLNALTSATVAITIRPNAVGPLTNSTDVTASRLDLIPANNVLQTAVAARLVTDLLVAPSASTNLVLLGEQIIYTLNVTNRGPNPTTNIRLVDALPPSFAFLSATPSQGACTNTAGPQGATLSCDLGTLASGARAQVTLRAAPTALGTVTNHVQVTSDEVDTLSANNQAETATLVTTAADLGVTMTDTPDPIAVGDVLTYDLIVTNRGPGFAYDVQLTNTLPPGVTFLSAVAPDGMCSHLNGIVQCALGILTPGAGTTVTIAVNPTAAGRLTNSARVSTLSIDVASANNLATVATEAALPPSILTPPQNRTVTNGANATFTVSAGGTSPFRYQWQYNPLSGTGYTDLPGATNNTLTVTNAQLPSSGEYRVRVNNLVGTILSPAATLTVLVPPTLSNLPDAQTDEDTPTALLTFTVNDTDAPAAALTLSASMSDPALVPTNNITFGGSGSNRTVQILPATNRFGTATITITARDASGLTASDTFLLTVQPVNDPPNLTGLLNRTMLEDGVLAIPLTITDPETPSDSLTLSIISSNTVLIPQANATLSGTGTNRLLILQPAANQSGVATLTLSATDTNTPQTGGPLTTTATFQVTVAAVNDPPTLNQPANVTLDEDAGPQTLTLTGLGTGATNEIQTLTVTATSGNLALIPNPTVTYTSPEANGTLAFTPLPNATGNATITLRVNDGGTSNNLLTRTFTLTVNASNDLPRLLDLTDLTTAEDTAAGPFPFRVDDVETAAGSLQLSASSSDTNLVPNAAIQFGGAGTNRTLRILPATNQFGSATITLTVTDADGGATAASFLLTVTPVNDPPEISAIPDQTIDENTSTPALAFSVQDVETPADALSVAPGSSNPLLVPLGNVALAGTGTNRTVTVTPAPNQFGVATITLTVTDTNGGTLPRSFLLTVRQVILPPVITRITHASPAAEISFSTQAGLSYTVEFKNAPETPGWNPLDPVIGTGGVMTVTDPAATVPSRIYRVRVE
jgi:uncharacterized repeat protein (TIGR01451 family)